MGMLRLQDPKQMTILLGMNISMCFWLHELEHITYNCMGMCFKYKPLLHTVSSHDKLESKEDCTCAY